MAAVLLSTKVSVWGAMRLTCVRWDYEGGDECLKRKVDERQPGKGNSNSHGARPVHLIITMITWIRTSRLSINNSLSECSKKVSRPGRPRTLTVGYRGASLIRKCPPP